MNCPTRPIGCSSTAYRSHVRTTAPVLALYSLLLSIAGHAQDRPPVIDVHMHATAIDSQGPPPVATCMPMSVPLWDPATDYTQVFATHMKRPSCEDPIWSPETDRDLVAETVEIMNRRNVIGILTDTPERVAEWMEAAPERFYPGVTFRIGVDKISPGSLKRLHEEGSLAVFGEITNAYVGSAPNDVRMEAYWALA